MNILYIITGLEKGGAETQLFRLAKELSKKNTIKIIAFKSGSLESSFKEANIPIRIISFSKITQIISIIKKIQEEILLFKPDIIHSWLPHANIVTKLALLSSKEIKKIPYLSAIRVKEIKFIIYDIIEKMLDISSIITVNSQIIKTHLKNRGFRSTKVQVIGNILNIKKPNQKTIKKLKKTYEGKKIVLSVAHFRPQKDYLTNIKTAEKILSQRDDVIFLYAGDGPLKNKIQKHIQKKYETKIQCLGLRHDISELMSICDVFFLPTLYEGQSNVLLEAKYMGCNIVTTNLLENKEILSTKDAILCKPKDSEAMAHAIIDMLKTKQKKQLVFKNNANIIANEYMNIYKTMLKKV